MKKLGKLFLVPCAIYLCEQAASAQSADSMAKAAFNVAWTGKGVGVTKIGIKANNQIYKMRGMGRYERVKTIQEALNPYYKSRPDAKLSRVCTRTGLMAEEKWALRGSRGIIVGGAVLFGYDIYRAYHDYYSIGKASKTAEIFNDPIRATGRRK